NNPGEAPDSQGVQVASGTDGSTASDAPPPEAGAIARRYQGVAANRGEEASSEGVAPPQGRPGLFSNVDLSANSKLWPALTAAGFAMMASRAPNLGAAIGEGRMTGLQTYAAEKEAQQNLALNQAKAEREEQRLDTQAAREQRQE